MHLYGAINLRTNGEKVVMAYELEQPLWKEE